MSESDLRKNLLSYFEASFERYESLFGCLKSDAAYFEKPISLRHPLIFYFGHTATFFVNKLLLAKLMPERINPRFEAMFAVGVDEMSWDDLDETHYDWPTVAEVKAYRQQVRSVVSKVICEAPWQGPMGWDNPWWAILMGIEHELIHLETSSVLIRQHRPDYVQPQADWAPAALSGIDAAAVPASWDPSAALVTGSLAVDKRWCRIRRAIGARLGPIGTRSRPHLRAASCRAPD
jgi:hypothetical protein